jgi:hypothetical protein
MIIDGVAVLRCWPITLTLGGHRYRISARPALDWILPIVEGTAGGIVPGMLDPTDPMDTMIDDMLIDGTITLADCVEAAHDAVSAAAGMPWWAAHRLVATVTQSPALAGALVLAGVDTTRISLAALCAATYRILTEQADEKQLTKLEHELMATPPGVSVEKRYDAAAAASAFEAAAAARGVSL